MPSPICAYLKSAVLEAVAQPWSVHGVAHDNSTAFDDHKNKGTYFVVLITLDLHLLAIRMSDACRSSYIKLF